MKILITGASGFIGSKLITALGSNKNYQLRALVRNPTSFKIKSPISVESFQWNPEERQIDPRALEDVNVIIHLAGESIASGRWTIEKKKSLVASRVYGTHLLMTQIEKLATPPIKFISASAIGFYGNRGSEILHENSSTGKGFLADLCHQWEAGALEHNISNMRSCVIRTGIVLGKSGGALPKMLTPFRLGLGGVLGNGKQYMSWIHINDLIGIFKFLIETNELKSVYNATAPSPVTNKEFTKTLGHVLDRPTLMPIPSVALKILLGEMAEILLEGQRVVPQRLLNEGYRFMFTDLEAALSEITTNKV